MAARDEMTVAAAAPRILLDDVSISYATPRGRLPVVDQVSLAVGRAEFVVLVGPWQQRVRTRARTHLIPSLRLKFLESRGPFALEVVW